jgi:hypothetical protein
MIKRALTNKIVDDRLMGRCINRIGNYTKGSIPMQWQCTIDTCQYIWKALPSSVIGTHKTGCPKCSGNMKQSIFDIDKRLKERGLIRVGKYNGLGTGTDLRCITCEYKWNTSPNTALNMNKVGCPVCSGHILTDKSIDKKLLGKNIKRIGSYNWQSPKTEFMCLNNDCGYRWFTDPLNLIRQRKNRKKQGTGCKKCAGLLKLTNEDTDKRLIDRNIKRVGDVSGATKPANFQCIICLYTWTTKPVIILCDKKSGCPKCNLHKNEKIIHKMLLSKFPKIEIQKTIKHIIPGEQRKIFVDFYLAECNTIIEYNGGQHYFPVSFNGCGVKVAKENFDKQQKRDAYLQTICNNNNIKLIWIDGRKYINKKLEIYINDIIIPMLLC